jgi:MerR family transcriptional regulator, light-induced transcriptional regulator
MTDSTAPRTVGTRTDTRRADDDPPGQARARLATALQRREDELVVAATARLLGGADAEDRPANDPVSEELGREQQRFHLQHLTSALAADRPQLFHEYARWAAELLHARGLGAAALPHHLDILSKVIADHLGPDADELAREVVAGALRAVRDGSGGGGSELDPDSEHAPLAASYLDAILAGDRRRAVRLVTEAAAHDIPLDALYLDVFAPALREVGRRWQLGRITIAQEHLATATTQLAIAQLYPRLFTSPRIGRTVVVASVGGELHEVGARIVADLFELRGWDSTFLGASTPVADLVAMVVDTAPDVLAISATLPTHVEQVRASIGAVRATGADPIVLVGGRPFLQVPDLWEQVGADGTAPDARSAVEEATRLVRAT